MERALDSAELQKLFVGRLLVPRLYGVLIQAHDQALEKVGLTVRQGMILVSCTLGETKTQAELARIYGLEASSINRLVERLVKKGFVHRRRSKTDRRQMFIEVTPAGAVCLSKGVPISADIERRAWKGVTELEKVAFESVVKKVVKNLGETSGPLQHHNQAKKRRSSVVV
jgi:DNA-binding MarR family transcriptional regulator